MNTNGAKDAICLRLLVCEDTNLVHMATKVNCTFFFTYSMLPLVIDAPRSAALQIWWGGAQLIEIRD